MVALSDQHTESSADVAPETGQPAQPSASDAAAHVTEAIQHVKTWFAEMVEYTQYLFHLQIDRGKLAAKRIAFYAILGILGLAVMAGFLAVGMGLLLVGLAGVIGTALGSFWLGATIIGAAMFILPAIAVFVTWNILNGRAQKRLEQKYADVRQKQKERFGHDVREVAHGQTEQA